MIKREDFIKIIKLRSYYKIDKRKGNYKLLNGYLSDYIEKLVLSQMNIDNLAIAENGNLCPFSGGVWNENKKWFEDYRFVSDDKEDEFCPFSDMEIRINKLVNDIIS